MSNSKLKQIKDVVRNFDVRDPRAAIVAIADIINAKSLAAKQPKPVLTIKVFEQGDEIDVALKHVANIDPSIVLAAKEVIDQFGQNKFGKLIRDADSGELVGFEKFGEHNGIRQISGPECDCPACHLKDVLTIKVFEQGDEIKVALKHVEGIGPAALLSAKELIDQFGQITFEELIRDADSFEKFGEHNGIRQISGPECDCPACRLKAVLKEIGAKIEAKRAEGDTPGPIKIDTGVPGLEAAAFTSIDDLMAHIKATDSGTTQGTN